MRGLTQRQFRVLDQFSRGKSIKQIAFDESVKVGTISARLDAARRKLEANNTAHAIRIAIDLEILI